MAGQDYTDAFAQLNAGPNMLQTAHEAAQLRQLGMANQAMDLQMKAREAMGGILQGAIDPSTGAIDYDKAFVGMAANPATAWMAPDFLDKAVARQATQRESALKLLEFNQKQQSAIYDAVAGLLPKREGLTKSDMMKAAADLQAAGIIDKSHYENFAQQLPADGTPMYQFAKQIALRAQGASKTLDDTHQKLLVQDTGGQVVLVQPDPIGGTAKQIGVVNKGLTPEKNAELVEYMDERGGKYLKPYGQIYGSDPRLAPGAQKVEGGDPARSSPPPPNPANPPMQAPLRKDLPIQTTEAWKKLAEQYNDVAALSSANQGVEGALDEAEKLLKVYTPNAGAEVRSKIASGLAALGVNPLLDGQNGLPEVKGKDGKPAKLVDVINNGSLSSGEVFKSAMLDLAANRLRKAIGAGRITNMEFGTFLETKPNPNMSAEAVRKLIQYYRRGVKIDRKYIIAYNQFMDKGKSPTEFIAWWQKKLDTLSDLRREED